MKKFIPALLLVLAVSACGNSVTASNTNSSAPSLAAIVSANPSATPDATKTVDDTEAVSALASKPFAISYACVTPSGSYVNQKTIEDIRIESLESCRALLDGYVPSEIETEAVALAFPSSSSFRTDLLKIYMECAALAQSPSDFATVDPEMLEAVALLCPGAGTPSPAATTSPVAPEVVPPADPELAKESEAAKKVANNGSFFVGSEILPGVWQSDLARVTDCYWEISDAQGNIIDNNFITLAPQFTVTIPADAVGFTASGCGFHWVSE